MSEEIQKHYDFKGRMHREDGPAYDAPSLKMWYIHGLLHREDGPAIMCRKFGNEYWVNGRKYKLRQYHDVMTRRSDNAKHIPWPTRIFFWFVYCLFHLFLPFIILFMIIAEAFGFALEDNDVD